MGYRAVEAHRSQKIISNWQTVLHNRGWNANYLCNHDQPRSVSRFGNDLFYRVPSAKMLATFIHMQEGTPYIYQGEELGMTNAAFESIDDYRDVETLNYYEDKRNQGLPEEQIMANIHKKAGTTPVPRCSGMIRTRAVLRQACLGSESTLIRRRSMRRQRLRNPIRSTTTTRS